MELPIVEFKAPWPLVNLEEEHGELVVRFHADAFHWTCVDDVGDMLHVLIDENECSPLVLDFHNVEFVTGAGLQKLVRANRRLHAEGRRLTIRNAGHQLLALLEAAGFAEQFNVESPLSFFSGVKG